MKDERRPPTVPQNSLYDVVAKKKDGLFNLPRLTVVHHSVNNRQGDVRELLCRNGGGIF